MLCRAAALSSQAKVALAVALLLALTACGGVASNSPPVTPVPTIASFSPASGASGTSVTITGTNLTGASAVTIGGKAATSFSVSSTTQVTAMVASGCSSGKISVTTAGGTATSSGSFTVLSPPAIASFSPTSGPIGAAVAIIGTNFTGATAVTFHGTAANNFLVNSDTRITATVASGTTTGTIAVTTTLGTATSATNFTVTTPPAISSFNPGSGPTGTAVVITGTSFSGTTAVAFNGKAASSFVVNSATQITAVVAAGTTSGTIAVTTPSGTATSASGFIVTSSSTTLDLTIDGLYLTQATQEYPNPQVPLVQNRSAWVRVFVLANQSNSVAPQVRVDFINGSTTNTLTIDAGSASVPLSIDPANAAASWNAALPAAWMQVGTHVVATVDPTNAIPESDKTNNTFTENLDVRALKTWKMTLIPVHTADGNQGVVENATRTRNDWMDFAKRLHPVPDAIDVTVGSVMNSSVTALKSDDSDGSWDTVLNEVTAKRSADGATDRYYFGAVHPTYNSGIVGLGWIGSPAAIGWDVTGSFPSVLAHEVGHNFGRRHSPCGNPSGVDPNYPYAGGVIGVPGWDVFASSNNLKAAATYTDIMGYCSTQWVSDYTYLGVLNFRQGSSLGIVVPGPGAGAGEGLLIWGRISNGQVTLEPAFRIPANSSLAEPGPYTWEARDAIGRVLASVNFDAHEVADVPDTSSVQLFSFVVPIKADVLAAIESMHIKLGNQEMAQKVQTALAPSEADLQNTVRVEDLPDHGARVVWDADRYPVVMLRDPLTGEVRGFLRGGSAEIVDAPAEIEVHVSGGIQSSFIRHQRTGE